MKTNKEVCVAFMEGRYAKSGNMTSYGDRLFSYNTIIAEYGKQGEMYVNKTKYSRTTSKQRTQFINLHEFRDFEEFVQVYGTTKYVPINTQCDLDRFV